MKIIHIGLWCKDLEKSKNFYMNYFNGVSNEKYKNEKKGFSSYFISFETNVTLELMHKKTFKENLESKESDNIGYAHIAFSTGSAPKVDELTDRLKKEGYEVIDGPRKTGDGYYESVVLDPDGNRVEITI